MTKKVTRIIFFAYHAICRPLPSCRFHPTCSAYALEAIEKYGVIKGSLKTIIRVLSCHPFSKHEPYYPVDRKVKFLTFNF